MSILSFIWRNINYFIAGFFVIVLLALFVLLYLKLREKMIERLVYSRSFSDIGAYEGEQVTLTETLYNPTILPLFAINIEAYVYNELRLNGQTPDPKKAMQYFVSRFNIMPFQQIKRSHTVTCAARGFYRLETVDIYYNKKTRYIDAPAELYIYPGIVPLYDRVDPLNVRQGDSVSRRPLIKDPFSFSGIRQYTHGDPFNSINFKATARAGINDISAFRVNNRDFCSNRTFMVYLNFQTSTEETIPTAAYNKMMELGMSFASDIIREAAYNGHRAGLAANPVTIDGDEAIRFPVESGETHLVQILKQLAKVRNRAGVSFNSLIEQDIKDGLSECEIYIITPFTDPEFHSLIYRLNALENTVCIVILTDEEKKRHEEEERIQNKKLAEAIREERTRLREKELAAIEKRLRRRGMKKSAAQAAAELEYLRTHPEKEVE